MTTFVEAGMGKSEGFVTGCGSQQLAGIFRISCRTMNATDKGLLYVFLPGSPKESKFVSRNLLLNWKGVEVG